MASNRIRMVLTGIWAAIAVFQGPLAARGDINQWEELPLQGGLAMYGIVVDPANSNHLFAIVGENDPLHLYESKDGGASWDHVAGIPWGIGGDPWPFHAPLFLQYYGSTTILAGRVRSDDNGAHWAEVSGVPGWITAADPANPLVLYASRESESSTTASPVIYKSADGGASWNALSLVLENLKPPSVCVHRTNSQIVLACAHAIEEAGATNGGIYRSADGGTTWTRVLTGQRFLRICSLPGYPSVFLATGRAGGGVWRSTDDGLTWTRVLSGTYNGLMPYPGAPDRVYLFSNKPNNVWRSDDAGLTFAQCGLLPEGLRQAVWCAGADPSVLSDTESADDTIYIGGHYFGVLKTTTGGASWTECNNGIRENEIWEFVPDPDDPDKVYIAGPLGVAVANLSEPMTIQMLPDFENPVRDLAFDCVDHNLMLAPSDHGPIYRSVDKGASWTSWVWNFYNVPYAVWASPQTPERMLIGIKRHENSALGGLWVTTNGGLSIDSPVRLSLPTYRIESGEIGAGQHAIFAGIFGSGLGGVYRSIDDGDSWIPRGLEALKVSALAVAPRDGNLVFVAGQEPTVSKMYRSEDGGTMWLNITPPGSENKDIRDIAFDLEAAELTDLYVSTYDTIYHSLDKGDHWTILSNGLENVRALYVKSGGVSHSIVRLSDSASLEEIYAGINGGFFRYGGHLSSAKTWSEYEP